MIPGVPLGAKVVRLAVADDYAEPGTYLLGSDGVIRTYEHKAHGVVMEPDNPYGKFLHEVESDIKAAGRERLGGDDYREPKDGEWVWSFSGAAEKAKAYQNWEGNTRFILKPLKRRVLVEHREYRVNEFGHVFVDGKSHLADYLQMNAPSIYRIEEREA